MESDLIGLKKMKLPGGSKWERPSQKQQEVQMSAASAEILGDPDRIIKDVESNQRIFSIFDAIGGLSDGEAGFGHSKKDHKGITGKQEFAANLFAAVVLNHEEFSVYFPKSWAIMKAQLGKK
jgi:hypothetical protein